MTLTGGLALSLFNGAEVHHGPGQMCAGLFLSLIAGEFMARLTRLPGLIAAAPRPVGFSDRPAAERARDKARAQANTLRPLYWSARWRALRLEILDRDNWTCRQTGALLNEKAPAPHSPVVDHIVPHRGNLALFWDPANLQAVSKAYHDGEKQRIEAATRPAR